MLSRALRGAFNSTKSEKRSRSFIRIFHLKKGKTHGRQTECEAAFLSWAANGTFVLNIIWRSEDFLQVTFAVQILLGFTHLNFYYSSLFSLEFCSKHFSKPERSHNLFRESANFTKIVPKTPFPFRLQFVDTWLCCVGRSPQLRRSFKFVLWVEGGFVFI